MILLLSLTSNQKIQVLKIRVFSLPPLMIKLKNIMGLDERKSVFGFAINKNAVQPAHQISRISTFVIRFLESIISKLATSKIAMAGFAITTSETLKTGFLAMRA